MMKFDNALRVLALASPILLAGCAGLNFGLAGMSGAAGMGEPQAKPHARAVRHFSDGQFGLAVKHFRRAVDEDPRSVESLNGLAASYDKLGRFDLSERHYRRALALDPMSSQTLNNLGYSYLMQGKYDLALVYLRDADGVAGDNEVIRGNRQAVETALGAPMAVTPDSQAEGATWADELTPAVWVERTTPAVQTLITQPAPDLIDTIKESGVTPRLASYRGAVLGGIGYIADPVIRPEMPRDGMVRPASYDLPAESAAASVDTADKRAVTGRKGPLIEVSNGAGRLGMAARLRNFLEGKGLSVARLTNAESYDNRQTTIFYRDGWAKFAKRLATLLPADIRFEPASQSRSDIRVRIGGDLLGMDEQLSYEEISDDHAG